MTAIAVLAVVSGLFIGCVGIGGVLLVPCLAMLGVDVHLAIAASMFSFLFSGLIGAWLYAREGSIAWAAAAWLGVGGMPGAFAGAVLAARLDGGVLLLLIGAAVIFAGLHALSRGRESAAAAGRVPSPWVLTSTGAGVGLASALTGTGGPLLLVPLLIWLRVPVLVAVGLGQAIQLPISVLATIGYVGAGQLDLRLALVLSAGVALGTAAGARIAHAIPTLALTRLVAIVLLIVGAVVVIRTSGVLTGAAP